MNELYYWTERMNWINVLNKWTELMIDRNGMNGMEEQIEWMEWMNEMNEWTE